MRAAVGAASASRAVTLHASAVAVGRRALVITGPAGSGKSGLALSLIALGARLVSDDRTDILPQTDGPPLAAAPDPIRGLIEARGLGVLTADPAPPTPVIAVLDLARTENERLPPRRTMSLGGADVVLLHRVESPHFTAALMLYLRGGASE